MVTGKAIATVIGATIAFVILATAPSTTITLSPITPSLKLRTTNPNLLKTNRIQHKNPQTSNLIYPEHSPSLHPENKTNATLINKKAIRIHPTSLSIK